MLNTSSEITFHKKHILNSFSIQSNRKRAICNLLLTRPRHFNCAVVQH